MLFQIVLSLFLTENTVFKYLPIQGYEVSKGPLVSKALLSRTKSGLMREAWLSSRPLRPGNMDRRREEDSVVKATTSGYGKSRRNAHFQAPPQAYGVRKLVSGDPKTCFQKSSRLFPMHIKFVPLDFTNEIVRFYLHVSPHFPASRGPTP